MGQNRFTFGSWLGSRSQRNSHGEGELPGKVQAPNDTLLGSARPKELTMAKGSVQIVVERCKACGFCVEFCPTKVLALSSAFNAKGYHTPYMVHPEKCSGCDLCGMYCPDFAIFGYKAPAAAESAAANAAPAAEPKEADDAR
jgi:2-oxoglutarate ferredoxin oxidoreductase subunit delta